MRARSLTESAASKTIHDMGAMIKIVIMLFFFLALLVPHSHAEEQAIQDIRTRYAKVNNNLKRYSLIEKNLHNYSTEGTSLTAHFFGSSPRKVTANVYGCQSQIIEEYYFWNNRLIFALVTHQLYESLASSKIIDQTQERYYFTNGRLIRWIDDKKIHRETTSANAKQKVRYVLDGAREWLNMAHSVRQKKTATS